MDTETLILSIVLALIATIPGIWALVAQRKKTRAEADNFTAQSAKLIQEASSGIIMRYKERIEELECEVKDLTARIVVLEEKLQDAYDEIRRLDILNKKLNRNSGKRQEITE